MKNLLIALLLLPALVQAQKNGQLKISATLSGLPDRTRVSLVNMNNQADTVAKAIALKGHFELAGSVPEPNLYQLNLDGDKKIVLFVGNDHVVIKGSDEKTQDAEITGSPSHSDFMAFQNTFNPLFKKLTEMGQQFNPRPEGSVYDSLVQAYQAQTEKIRKEIDRFITEKRSSYVAPFLMVVTAELEQDVAAQEKHFQQLSLPVQKGFFGKIMKQQIDNQKIGAIGSKAMEFSQNDTSGHAVSLSSFRGKYVLLDFWASWCRPCRMENPNVVAVYNKFKEKNFTILSVSLDKDRKPWLNAIKQDNLTWSHVSDLKYWNNEVARLYRVESIPKNYLIDPDGKIVGKDLRGDQLTAKLCEMLGCN